MDFNSLTKKLIKSNIENLFPLEKFIPNGISNYPFIHISGDSEIGKTSLALEIIYRNPNKTFLYIDTYFQITESHLNDNMQFFKSNIKEEIYSFIESIEEGTLDYIIIDSFSNLISIDELKNNTDIYIENRYLLLNDWLKKFLELCTSKKITLIVMNTLNWKGEPYNFSNQIKQLCSLDLKIINKVYNDNNSYTITLIANKNKYRDFYTQNEYEILLNGKGVVSSVM